jgi:hypothetical protein
MDDRGFQKINLKASEDVVSQKPMEASSSK